MTDAGGHRPVLRVGCPMWAHPPWVGRYLSAGNKGNELAEYATWCNAVEGNTTFYAEPAASTVARWAEQAPPEFRFAFKVPRTITHERRLHGDAHRAIASFLRAIEPLGERVGPVQLQLPPSFGPEQLRTLAAFVVGLPMAYEWMVELRHPAFFDDSATHRAVDDALGGAGVGRVVLDTRPLYAAPPGSDAAVDERRTKPRLPVVTALTGRSPIVRVIGADDPAGTLTGLDAWTDRVVGWLGDGLTPYVFVHQPENLRSPDLARRFHELVSDRLSDLVPLPDPLPVAERGEVTGQDRLF